MIPVIPFAIGFVIYVSFCLLTFEFYSQRKEMTKMPVLVFFYLYYTILSWYVIGIVEEDGAFVQFIQTMFYAIPCAFILLNYYNKNIKSKDERMYGQNV